MYFKQTIRVVIFFNVLFVLYDIRRINSRNTHDNNYWLTWQVFIVVFPKKNHKKWRCCVFCAKVWPRSIQLHFRVRKEAGLVHCSILLFVVHLPLKFLGLVREYFDYGFLTANRIFTEWYPITISKKKTLFSFTDSILRLMFNYSDIWY